MRFLDMSDISRVCLAVVLKASRIDIMVGHNANSLVWRLVRLKSREKVVSMFIAEVRNIFDCVAESPSVCTTRLT